MGKAKKFPIFNYKKEDGCLFYERVSSYEDVDPYLDNELSVVCDGSGGAGGFYHYVKTKKVNSYDKIKDIVLPEDKEDSLKEYIEKIFEPIINSKDEEQKRTSAFFASRIVMPRFVYAYKTLGKDNMKEITQFVVDGMERVARKLDFHDSEKTDKALLPTTFVAIALDKENDKDVEVDVYWAGDSRAYYLSRNGLKQLSIDDEDASGSITNLFTIKEGIKPRMNHRHYVLSKPCLLFTCSDGIFDVYDDNLSLEYVLLHYLVEATSMEDLATLLANHYNGCKSDDCTLSMRKFGYPDYLKMREEYRKRLAADEALYIRKKNLARAYEIKEDPSLYTNAIRRLVSRTTDIFPDIVAALADALSRESTDPFVKEVAKDLKPCKEAVKETKTITIPLTNVDKDKILKNLEKLLCFEVFSINYKDVFDVSKMDKNARKDFDTILEKQEAAKKYDAVINDTNDARFTYSDVCEKIWNELKTICSEMGGLLKTDMDKIVKSATFTSFMKECKNGLPKGADKLLAKYGKKELVNEYNTVRKALVAAEAKKDQLDNNGGKILPSHSTQLLRLFFRNYREQIFSYLRNSISNKEVKKVLNPTTTKTEVVEERVDEDVATLIARKYRDEAGKKEFVNQRVELGTITTIVDRFYNSALLKSALEYHEAMKVDAKVLEQFRRDYNSFEASFEELLID